MSEHEIPREVDSQEIIVRTVKNPNHVDSKGKLRDNLFMPSGNHKEISVLRLPYTTPDFCKKHSHKILNHERNESFHGLGIIYAKTIRSTSVADVVGTPIDENGEYINSTVSAYITDPGIPAHGDLIYDAPPPEPGVPSNPIKKAAREIWKKSKIKIDTDTINVDKWTGQELIIEDED